MAQSNTTVQPGRIRVLKKGSRPLDHRDAAGPVVYWMFRDQRVRDNWALIHAVDEANKANVPVAVVFNLFDQFLGAKARQLGFMLRGLQQLHTSSEKLEYSARTIRGKINKLLPEYMIDFPKLGPPIKKWASTNHVVDWENLITAVIRKGAEVPELEWCEPGEDAAMEVLMGNRNGFLTKRLKGYSSDRNNPLKPKALSGLSPYLHFGQISAQRCATEARKVRTFALRFVVSKLAVDVFLEELIVRRELADNFCFYQPQYDSLKGAWEWARKTLMDHASDKREHIYTFHMLTDNAMECFSVGDGSLRKDAWLYEASIFPLAFSDI
ncbi:hypothetical protein C3L33_09137, partial [Rhododendron williamsianum]